MKVALLVSLLSSLSSLFPSTSPAQDRDCSSRVITRIPVADVVSCTATPTDVLIVAKHEVVCTSPSLVWLSLPRQEIVIGFLCGGDEAGWVHLQELTVPVGPGTLEMSWTDKFGRTVRVVVPCNGLTEDACAKLFQARVTMMEKMYPPAQM